MSATPPAPGSPLTPNQLRGFWATWAGWALDGMDSFIYALVLVPALRDLLLQSGIHPDQASIGFYGGALFAIFLIGARYGWRAVFAVGGTPALLIAFIGTPVALTSVAFLAGLALLPWAEETRGKELPA